MRDKDVGGVIELIRKEVARSATPVPCSRLASLITSDFGAIAADWNGKGTFRKFIEALELDPLQFDWNTAGGVIQDPTRTSSMTRNGSATSGWSDYEDILPVASQIHEVSGVPLLRPEDYRALFSIIEQDVRSHPFELKETGKRVRDGLREGGFGGRRLGVDEGSELEVLPREGVRVHKRPPTGPTETTANVKQRRGQDYFRDAVLNNFGGRCGVTNWQFASC